MFTTSRVLCAALLLAGACDKGPSHKTQGDPAVASATPTTTTPAATPTATELSGTKFGAGVTLADAVPVSTLLADPASFKGKTVRVEGMITDVCPKRGCWFEMAGENAGEKLRFKVEDGVMVFPVDAKGKYTVAEGTVVVDQLTLDETVEHLAHQAEEHGTEFDPASVTEPLRIVRLDGSGAVIRDAR